jgi:hypothetical protein
MKLTPIRGLLLVGALCASLVGARAQIVELRATLSASQEVPASSSPATGSAIMLYDVGTNTFDLMVTINGMTNPATASHIHEAAAGVNGPVVTNLGGEAVYTRSGSTLRATFRNVTHGGDRVKLLQAGAYYNIHSAQFPGGEIRGQLIARPVRLVANLDTAQEQAAFPAVNLSSVTNFGGAVMLYDPVANTISIKHSLFGFTNPFTNSHIHNGAVGVSGGVNTQLGTNANAGAYNSSNGYIAGSHDNITYGGNPIELLTGLNYLNYHSQTFTGGQLRGQIYVSNETASTRFQNFSTRGFVGTAAGQELIGGFTVHGTEPVRTLITAKGPSLAAFGVTGALANPRLTLFDATGRQIATNDDVGAIAAGSELSRIPGMPTNTAESALVVVLPPGNYTALVSSTTGTGVALLEAYDLRTLPSNSVVAMNGSSLPARAGSLAASAASTKRAPNAAVELCEVPVAVAMK